MGEYWKVLINIHGQAPLTLNNHKSKVNNLWVDQLMGVNERVTISINLLRNIH